MIQIYGLAYRRPDYLEKCIESLFINRSEPVEINVAESKSPVSLRPLLEGYVKGGQIKRACIFEENVASWGLQKMIEDFPPQDKFFIMTDLDLIVPTGCDYLGIIREAQERNVLTGCTLSLENYVPPNWGYGGDADGFGGWLMSLRTDIWKQYPAGCPIADAWIIEFFKHFGLVEKLLDIRLYHLAWDLWKDDPEYLEHKIQNHAAIFNNGNRPVNLNYELIER